MRLIKIQYPFLEKIPLCRERKSCGIEHTEFIEVVNLFISLYIQQDVLSSVNHITQETSPQARSFRDIAEG